MGRGAVALALALLLTAALAPLARATHSPPTDVTVSYDSFSGEYFYVEWTASAGADGYKVQWKSGTQDWDASREKTAASSGVLLIDFGTKPEQGVLYTVRVGATKSTEEVAWIDEADYVTIRGKYDCGSTTAVAGFTNVYVNHDNNDLEDDCENLLNSKTTLDPDGRLNWDTSLSMNSWDGISIYTKTHSNSPYYRSRVTYIELNGPTTTTDPRVCDTAEQPATTTKLRGSIPAAYGGLSFLTILQVRNHELSNHEPGKPFPDVIYDLPDLNWFILDGNCFTGNIPAGGDAGNPTGLAKMTQMHLIYLSNNDFTGDIPAGVDTSNQPTGLARLNQVWRLLLSGNQLSGNIPAALKHMQALQNLWLHNNQLTGSIPPELGDLNSTPVISSQGFKDLRLQNNPLSGSIPKELGKLARLQMLNLYNTNVSGEIPPELGNIGKDVPYEHDSSNNPKTDYDIQVFLNCNKLTGQAPAELKNIQGKVSTVYPGKYAEFTKLGLNGNPGLNTANLKPDLAEQLTAGKIDCPDSPSRPGTSPAPAPPRPRARLTASLTAAPDPVSVGESVTYTLTVTNTGGVPLSGLFWRSPELGVARRAIGDGALAVDAAATTTFSFGLVTDRHLPGPIVVNVFADSDQTNAAQAGLAVAVQVATTPPPSETPPTSETPSRDETAAAATDTPADPRPAVSALDLAIIRVFYSMPDPPDPNLGHNILALQLTLADGTAVACDFLAHYLRTGGLARWGYATSEILEERPNTLTQYYQRGAVDCHFRDGRWRVERRLTWDFIGGGLFGAPDLGVEPPRSEQPGVFPSPWGLRVSNFAVDGTYTGFLDFFYRYGGVPAFGYPKTEARYDDDPAAVLRLPGAPPGVIRQYFQAAVFEHHPDDPASPVKLGLAGDVLRDLLYPNRTHQRFASFRPAPILTSGEGYVAERVVWNPPPA